MPQPIAPAIDLRANPASVAVTMPSTALTGASGSRLASRKFRRHLSKHSVTADLPEISLSTVRTKLTAWSAIMVRSRSWFPQAEGQRVEDNGSTWQASPVGSNRRRWRNDRTRHEDRDRRAQ